MNVGSGNAYPASALSNFTPRRFVFDGVECHSLEGVLQAFKFDKEHIQAEVCKLAGKAAKFRGKKRNKHWQQRQTLWWKGKAYLRDSQAYQELLDRLYRTVFDQCENFRDALKASGKAVFTHTIGHNDDSKTVLTEREFCARLTKMRNLL